MTAVTLSEVCISDIVETGVASLVVLLHAYAWWVDIFPRSLSLSTDMHTCMTVCFYQLSGRGVNVTYIILMLVHLTSLVFGRSMHAYAAYCAGSLASFLFGHTSCMRYILVLFVQS